MPNEPVSTISLFKDYRDLLPDIRFVFVNLNKIPDKEIRGIAKLKMLFLLLKHVRTPGLIKIMPRVIELYREQKHEEDALECFEAMLRYLAAAVPDEIDSIVSILREGDMEDDSGYRRILELLMPDVVEGAKRALRKELEQNKREEIDKAREEADKAKEEADKAKEEADKAKEEAGKAKEEAVRNLIMHGMDNQTISRATGLEQERIEELRRLVG